MTKLKCLNPWDPQSKRQYQIDGVYAALNSGQSCGGQAHGVCYSLHEEEPEERWQDDSDDYKEPQTVCYAIEGHVVDRNTQNNMKSGNPHSGIHETDIAKCLDTMCLNPSCNQGGQMVVIALEGNGARPSHRGDGYSDEGKSFTLNTIDRHAVCYSVDCRNLYMNEQKSGTIQAKNEGGFSLNFVNPVLYENE